jgi:hypothetical protein
MLNVYNYYISPKSLPAPGEKVVQEWVAERNKEMPKFLNDLWYLQSDYDVGIGHNEKPNGDSWFSAKWGRDGIITFYIPAESFTAHEVDNTNQSISIYADPHDIINILADELRLDGAYREDDEDDAYEDDYDQYDQYDD